MKIPTTTLLVRYGPSPKQFKLAPVPDDWTREDYAKRLAHSHHGRVSHTANGDLVVYTYH